MHAFARSSTYHVLCWDAIKGGREGGKQRKKKTENTVERYGTNTSRVLDAHLIIQHRLDRESCCNWTWVDCRTSRDKSKTYSTISGRDGKIIDKKLQREFQVSIINQLIVCDCLENELRSLSQKLLSTNLRPVCTCACFKHTERNYLLLPTFIPHACLSVRCRLFPLTIKSYIRLINGNDIFVILI